MGWDGSGTEKEWDFGKGQLIMVPLYIYNRK